MDPVNRNRHAVAICVLHSRHCSFVNRFEINQLEILQSNWCSFVQKTTVTKRGFLESRWQSHQCGVERLQHSGCFMLCISFSLAQFRLYHGNHSSSKTSSRCFGVFVLDFLWSLHFASTFICLYCYGWMVFFSFVDKFCFCVVFHCDVSFAGSIYFVLSRKTTQILCFFWCSRVIDCFF